MTKPSKFSERIGIITPRTFIQLETMDEELLNDLWNFCYSYLIKNFRREQYFDPDRENGVFFSRLWTQFFNQPINKIPRSTLGIEEFLEDFFFEESEWYEVYDFLEACQTHLILYPGKARDAFSSSINLILEDNLSGYRFVSNLIAPIVEKEEIKAIEVAISNSDVNQATCQHLQEAILKIADRKNPDYRNSIKESISAVEALAIFISGNPKAILSTALDIIEKSGRVKIHRALKNGFTNIYGWTCDDQGIRHALQDEPTLSQEDAIFMLVICSAFVNYLLVKYSKI